MTAAVGYVTLRAATRGKQGCSTRLARVILDITIARYCSRHRMYGNILTGHDTCNPACLCSSPCQHCHQAARSCELFNTTCFK